MTRFAPTDEQRKQVEILVGLGLTYDEIASVIISPRTKTGISKMTLQKYFPVEIAAGAGPVKARIVTSLVKRAEDHAHPQGAASAMFIMKCRFGWKEKHAVEITSKSGVMIAPAAMTPEEWIAAQAEADKDKKAPGDE